MLSVPRYCGICHTSATRRSRRSQLSQLTWLPQVSLSTLSKIKDTASSTILTQSFFNPSETTITNAKYTFPLYESCAVVSFRCYVGERLIAGVVKEKGQAKTEYKKAVQRGETAGLLEQNTPDVFSTNLGNIPAGETVKVEIQYLIELKHDAEVDGLRFTIPTSIAPRYGDAPAGLNIPGEDDEGGMKISVHLTMPSNIRSVRSPSHGIAMHLGGHIVDVPDDAFDPKHALATLSQPTTVLAKDFVVIVKCSDLSFPRALLETHPTIPNSKALMITLVPKFTLPPGVKPEVVFVVDRSGSMENRMKPLKSSLGVFLKSLPIGVKFNICSFGSRHSFLWPKSQSYSAEALEEANRHVQSMQANFGGTEILPALKSTVSSRLGDLPLEIMLLTDGEVWNTETLFEDVRQWAKGGDVRLFSLGIGQDVSHTLVEGMARVGRGFAQILSDEKEGMEDKVVRMLRGALGAHVNDYMLEWDGKPREVDTGKPKSAMGTLGESKTISLFNTATETEAHISFSGLPEFVVPSVLQAPYDLPPLFPFSRYNAYAILSGDEPAPSSLWLRGTTNSGDKVELEVPVQDVQEGDLIHKLAARKILQELEEGTGYIHSGKYGVDREQQPGTFDEWVQREGVRVGVKYGLASKWTSFVAVQDSGKSRKEKSDVNTESVTELGDDEFDFMEDDVGGSRKANDPSSLRFMDVDADMDESDDMDLAFDLNEEEFVITSSSGGSGSEQTARKTTGGSRTKQTARKATGGKAPRMQLATPSQKSPVKRKRVGDSPVQGEDIDVKRPHQDDLLLDAEMSSLDHNVTATPRERTMALIALQTFEGSFPLTQVLAALLSTTLADLESKVTEFVPALRDSGLLSEDQRRTLWATVLAVGMLEGELGAEKEIWVLVMEKARAWMSGLVGAGYADIEASEGLVREVLGGGI